MNNTTTATADKKTFPLRLPPETYKKIKYIVQKEKDKGNYSYSINELLTEIVTKRIQEEEE